MGWRVVGLEVRMVMVMGVVAWAMG